jgi:hypothetical protein
VKHSDSRTASVLLAAILALAAAFLLVRHASAFHMSPAGPVPAAPQQNGATPPAGAPGHGLHVITVTFDYDFGRTPACTAKIQGHCAAQFVVYDISAGLPHRARLFTIPVPEGAKGQLKGITAASPKLDFQSGRHQIAVTAQDPKGVESGSYAATVWVVIP